MSIKPSHPADTDRIFVVERDEVIRSALQFILNDHSETHGFKGLDEAFAKAAALPPNIVMVGIGLIENDGERAVTEIAARLPGAKILIVANSINDPLALASLRWGAHDVLGKPISFDSVRGRVDAVLGRHVVAPAMLGLLPLSAAW